MTDAPEPAPRFERFRLTYPSGTVIESYSSEGELLETLRAVHPLAVVEPVEDSLVHRIQPSATGQARWWCK